MFTAKPTEITSTPDLPNVVKKVKDGNHIVVLDRRCSKSQLPSADENKDKDSHQGKDAANLNEADEETGLWNIHKLNRTRKA